MIQLKVFNYSVVANKQESNAAKLLYGSHDIVLLMLLNCYLNNTQVVI